MTAGRGRGTRADGGRRAMVAYLKGQSTDGLAGRVCQEVTWARCVLGYPRSPKRTILPGRGV